MKKLIIFVQDTAVEAYVGRKPTDATVIASAQRAIAAVGEYGVGTAASPTIFKLDGEKVKAHANKDGDLTIVFTGIHAEAPKNAPIEL